MKALTFQIESQEIKLPSHADLVEGLTEKIDLQIGAYDRNTVDSKLDNLSSVYLGINDKAVTATRAEYATLSGSATYDNEPGNTLAIHEKYYKKTDTVGKASADADGNNIKDTYANKTGSYAGLTAGHATTSGGADYATYDAKNGNNIRGTYIKSITDNGTQTITYTRGDNSTGTFSTKDTTYDVANSSNAGLMSAAHYSKLEALPTNANLSNITVASAKAADKLSSARKISIGGGASGSASFDGSSDCQITLSTFNASSITSGTLAVARGGTGATNLTNVTVGGANKWNVKRTLTMKGAASGAVEFDGSANVTLVADNLDVSKTTNGILPTLNGGTGNAAGLAQGLAKAVAVNGVSFDGKSEVKFAGLCNTAAATAAKTVTITGFALQTYAVVSIMFQYKNTASANITLNVNSTGAKPIKRNNAAVTGAFTSSAYQTVDLIYYSDAWHIVEPNTPALANARSIRIANGIVANPVEFDGSANVTLNANSINFNGFTSFSGAVPVANGGTGQTDGTVAKLHTPRTINGVNFDGSASCCFVALCDTAASDPNKVATLTNFTLTEGSLIAVRFKNINTADSPTLNVNGIGALGIYRGQGKSIGNTLNSYEYQVLWFHLVKGSGSYYWRIVESTSLRAIKLSGDIAGEASVGLSQTLTLNAEIKPSAFKSVTLSPSDYDNDLNNIKTPGYYRLHWLPSWKHRPSTAGTATYYMNVLKSGQSAAVLQQLYQFQGTHSFVRAFANSTWYSWREYNTDAVSSIDTISGETEPAEDPS